MLSAILATTFAGVDAWDLFRVDDPDYPNAVARSRTGAVIIGPPPPGTPYRWEPIGEPDIWRATEALEVTNADLWHDSGLTGKGVKIAVFDIGWFEGDADPSEIG